jgi:pantoate--beta-alanine ligase
MKHSTRSQHGCLEVVRTVAELRAALAPRRDARQSIALVPTMGALHEGHLSLVRHARERADVVVASLFVNPSQFNERADLESYPRSERRDAELAAQAGADILFAPAVEEVYPQGFATAVEVLGLTDRLEGAARGSAHFRGVTTVVTKLLCMAMPDVAYFGQKDAQQFLVIRRLVADLNLPTRVEALPTVRESDGLALSSRNQLLSAGERRQAAAIPVALAAAERAIAQGHTAADAIVRAASGALAAVDLTGEYVAVVDADTLEPLQQVRASALLLLAVRVGSVRLIDNVLLRANAVAHSSQAIQGGALAQCNA